MRDGRSGINSVETVRAALINRSHRLGEQATLLDLHGQSTPKTSGLFLFEGSFDLFGDVHGVVDVLQVVELLQPIDEAHDLLRIRH